MTVGGDEAAVEADVARLAGGHDLQLGGDEVLLHDAVFLIEELEDVELEAIRAVLSRERTAADEQVQALAGNGLVERLFALLAAEVRQQIVDDELRVALVRADVDGDRGTVAAHDHAVQLKGDRHPLVLADTAVVVGLEVGHLGLLVERTGL